MKFIFMNQISKNKRFIFALAFFILINISFIVNVNALTDDNGNEIKCIIQESGLNIQSDRDFCLTFDTEIKGEKYAKLCWYSSAYGKNICNYIGKDYKYLFIDTSGNYRPTTNQNAYDSEYMIYILANYYESPSQIFKYDNFKILNNYASDYSNRNNLLNVYTITLGRTQYESLNSNNIIDNGYNYPIGVGYQGLILKIKNNVLSFSNEGVNSEFLSPAISMNDIDERLLTTNLDIYEFTNKNLNWYDKNMNDYNQIELIKDNSKKPIVEEIEIVKGEIGKNIKFKYNNLKENYLIDIKRKDVETKKNLEWKSNPIRSNITFSTIEFEDLTDSYIFERTVYDENKNIIFQKEEIISFGGLFDDINENSGVSDYFGFIKIFLKKASAIISPIFAIFNYFFNNIDPFMQLGMFCSFIILIIYFIMRGVRK